MLIHAPRMGDIEHQSHLNIKVRMHRPYLSLVVFILEI